MKVHNFVVDNSTEEKYLRVIFCRRCGQVVWNYNISLESNHKLQDKIKDCVESGEEIEPPLKGK